MLTLIELQQIAGRLTGARFVNQVGPFVLLQHSAGAPLLDGDERKRTAVIGKMAMVRLSVEMKSELSSLEVTLLPPVSASGELKVGRGPDNDLIVDDPSASKHHAVLRWCGRHCELVDLDSMNGTSVAAQMLSPSAPHVLKDGEVISFGGTQFVYYTSPRIFDILSGSLSPQR